MYVGVQGIGTSKREARKAGAGPVVHPAPCLTHYPSCPFILPRILGCSQ